VEGPRQGRRRIGDQSSFAGQTTNSGGDDKLRYYDGALYAIALLQVSGSFHLWY
jgi:hypothetical protein